MKQYTIMLPNKFKLSSKQTNQLIDKYGFICPICGMPWPEKFEIDNKGRRVGIYLSDDIITKLQCLDGASNFLKTLIEAEKSICPACKR